MRRRDFLGRSFAAGAIVFGQAIAVSGRSPSASREWKFDRVAGPFSFSEGPVWDGKAVLFTDIRNNRIMRYDPRDSSCLEFLSDTKGANGLALDRQGRLIACQGGSEGRSVIRYEKDGSLSVLADRFEGKRFNSPNDLAIDSLGRVWFTDPRYGDRSGMDLDHESVYRLESSDDQKWGVQRMTFDTTRPNGILITPDLQTMYGAQSDHGEGSKRELRAYPILENGALNNYRVLHDFGPHRGVDGMTFDSDFNIVASAGSDRSGPGPMIYLFAPSGRVLETHPTPLSPTNCVFGDEDLRSLYVTVYDGSLYRARTDREGYHSVLLNHQDTKTQES
jgi:gluconolactonase